MEYASISTCITIGAYNRNESRGAHYKPEFPDRNDDEWLKLQWLITKVELKTRIYLRASRCKLIPPRKRDYTSKSKGGKK